MNQPAATIRRQLLAHLRLVHGTGIEWLPAPPLAVPAPVKPTADDAPAASSAMFDIAEDSAAQPGSDLSLDDRRIALQALADEVKTCMRCSELCSTRTQTVFGDGRPGVDLCFIGEAPGADEDAQGVPFVGAAGQLLNRIIAAMGLQRDEVYICNILKCRPPGNRTPLADEAGNCRPFLERQLALVQPKFLVALGGCAATNLLQSTLSVGKLRGRFHDYKGIPVVVTYHPAYLLPHKRPDMKREVWEDMKMLLTRMGRPIPQKSQ
ncbi:MAG: uracil-DNA glycosylase [Planctomycetes bacterium]|nr:uracil-DNA glycosylase [Planctomycetota bacterium]